MNLFSVFWVELFPFIFFIFCSPVPFHTLQVLTVGFAPTPIVKSALRPRGRIPLCENLRHFLLLTCRFFIFMPLFLDPTGCPPPGRNFLPLWKFRADRFHLFLTCHHPPFFFFFFFSTGKSLSGATFPCDGFFWDPPCFFPMSWAPELFALPMGRPVFFFDGRVHFRYGSFWSVSTLSARACPFSPVSLFIDQSRLAKMFPFMVQTS